MGKSSRKKKGGGGDQQNNTKSAAAAGTAPPAGSEAAANGGATLEQPIYLKRAHDLKEEGNRRFQAKDFAAALQHYAAALELIPLSHPDRAVFHSNRAACLMQIRPVDHDAVAAECSLALQVQPRFPRALLRRARALESLGRYDLAMQDVQALLDSDPSHPDALDAARRLRAAAIRRSGETAAQQHDSRSKPPSPAALGASAVLAPPIAVTGLGGPPPRTKPASAPAPLPKKASSFPPPKSGGEHRLNNVVQLPSSLPPSVPAAEAATEAAEAAVNCSILTPGRASGRSKSSSGLCVPSRPLKLIYGHDIRLSRMPVNCSFRALREIVAQRFPSSKFVLIKYEDVDGDLVTITCTAELRLAESCVDSSGDRKIKEFELGKEAVDTLKLLRLCVVEVDRDQEPAFPEEGDVVEGGGEEEEEKKTEDEGVNLLSTVASESSGIMEGNDSKKANAVEDGEGAVGKGGKNECCHAECKDTEIDDWLFEFAQLFREQVGIDPEAHLDLHELGMEICSEALEATLTSDAAQGLFEKAASKFQEVVALAFFNWGNVYMCAARKRIPIDNSTLNDAVKAQLLEAFVWVQEMHARAQLKYEEALRVKPDFYDGLLALGQHHLEAAKLNWCFALANKVDLATWDSSTTIQLFDMAEEKMKAATEMWERVEEQAVTRNKADESLRQRRNQSAMDVLSAIEVEQAEVMRYRIHLFWGNMLYERSQVEFRLGFGVWEKNLDASVQRFKLSGVPESDIAGVLKNHSSNGVFTQDDTKKDLTLNGDASISNVQKLEEHSIAS